MTRAPNAKIILINVRESGVWARDDYIYTMETEKPGKRFALSIRKLSLYQAFEKNDNFRAADLDHISICNIRTRWLKPGNASEDAFPLYDKS